jgi:hypothetical protein
MTTSATETNSPYGEIKEALNSLLDKLESEQSKVNKAFFEALTMEQRDKFCQSLENQDVKAARIVKLTGKSQPTVNRHLNGKNS